MKKILIPLLLIILISGCQTSQTTPKVTIKDQAILSCKALCQSKLTAGQNLNNGPCLSNEIAQDWVCDVAHNPRQPIDNLQENQCSSFREDKTHHFVEVDESCEVIQVY